MLEVIGRPDLWYVLDRSQCSSHHAENRGPDVESLRSDIFEYRGDDDHNQGVDQGHHSYQQSCLPPRGFSAKLFVRDIRRAVAEEDEEQDETVPCQQEFITMWPSNGALT